MTPSRYLFFYGASALFILWLGAGTGIDMALARSAFNSGSGTFPLRHAWLTEVFGHQILKHVLSALGGAVILALIIDALRPFARLTRCLRLRLRVVALSAVLVPLTVTVLKRASSTSCPWDLIEFGGTQAYAGLLQAALPGSVAGHCMPGGHAASAMWLAALAVLWLPHRPRIAMAVGAGGLVVGMALGWLQQLRGAHFLTHTLWTAWIACAIVGVLYWLLVARARNTDAIISAYEVARHRHVP